MALTQFGFPENWQRHSFNEYDCYRNRPLELQIKIWENLKAAGYAHYIKQRASCQYQYHLYYFDLPYPFFVEIGYIHKTGVIDHMQYNRHKEALDKYGTELILKSRELPEGDKGLSGESN